MWFYVTMYQAFSACITYGAALDAIHVMPLCWDVMMVVVAEGRDHVHCGPPLLARLLVVHTDMQATILPGAVGHALHLFLCVLASPPPPPN